jgi:hypothetical protein
MADRVLRLIARAQEERAPLVATTCGSGRMPRGESCPGGMVVPLDPDDRSWCDRVEGHRFFHLEKQCGAWRAFEGNPNAARLFLELGVLDWVVFGNGLDLCVDQAVQNLLSLGLSVAFLSDVLIPSATGYGPLGDSGTQASRERTLGRWRELGAREMSLEDFLASREALEPATVWLPKHDVSEETTFA